MKLTERLQSIYDMIPTSDILCDVGSDHAYIPIQCLKTDKCKFCNITDVKEGPVKISKRNISANNIEESKVAYYVGYGLSPLDITQCDSVVIAGMGGILISDILERDIEKAKATKCLILQPMYAIEALRKWLLDNGFEIEDEDLSREGSKLYVCMKVKWTGNSKVQNDFYLNVGKKLIEKNHPLLPLYLKKMYKQNEKIITGMKKAKNTDESLDRVIKLNEDIERYLNESK